MQETFIFVKSDSNNPKLQCIYSKDSELANDKVITKACGTSGHKQSQPKYSMKNK